MKQPTAVANVFQTNDWTKDCGPLRALLLDPSITEVMVNSFNEIFVEKDGVLVETNIRFPNDEALFKVVQALVVTAGKEINIKIPFVDTSLPDGSRLNCVIPPIAINGPCLTIRKFSPQALNFKQLLESETLDDKLLYFLNQMVRAKQNILVSGGTGSGKTTLLNVLSTFVPSNERILTIEDTAELQLKAKNIVRLESKQVKTAGSSITIQDLIKNALRMRPNRIIIGECRGAETWDMLLAMNTGHAGSMTTIHANSAHDALRRLEGMILRSIPDLPLSIIQEDIANSIHFVIQVERTNDGTRRVIQVLEICGRNQNGYLTEEIFKYSASNGFYSTGAVPKFARENQDPRIKFPPNFFDTDFTVTI